MKSLETRYPIRETFFACCASLRVTKVRMRTRATANATTVFLIIRLSVYCRSLPHVQNIFCPGVRHLSSQDRDCDTLALIVAETNYGESGTAVTSCVQVGSFK